MGHFIRIEIFETYTRYILRLQQDDPQLLVDLPQEGDLFLLKMLRAGEAIKKNTN